MTICNHCFGDGSYSIGEIFCSEKIPEPEGLGNGILFLDSEQLVEIEHTTRASVRLVLAGEQRYLIGQNLFRIDPNLMLFMSSNTTYKMSFDARPCSVRMVSIEFSDSFLGEVYTSRYYSADTQLEDPHLIKPFELHNQVFRLDRDIKAYIESYTTRSLHADSQFDFELIAERIMGHLLGLPAMPDELPITKPSTKKEITRRLTFARDYIRNNFDRELTIAEVAREACLSSHYFKRLFKQAFRISPHQYLVQVRMGRARLLLNTTKLHVNEICQCVGFQNASSFIRLFKGCLGITPENYRRSGINTSPGRRIHAMPD